MCARFAHLFIIRYRVVQVRLLPFLIEFGINLKRETVSANIFVIYVAGVINSGGGY